MLNPETQKIIRNGEYRKIYKKIIDIRSRLTTKNKALLNEGQKHEYQCNCNILRGMNLVIEKLSRV